MPIAFIGIGSNVEPEIHLPYALNALAAHKDYQNLELSPLYRTKPWGPIQNQPDFINGVIKCHTTQSPLTLLDTLQTIEQEANRTRALRYGPRTLDLDLLLYDERSLQSERLTIPHPRLTERAFVVIPLHTLAPTTRLPDGTPISALIPQDAEILKPATDYWAIQLMKVFCPTGQEA